MHLFKAGFTTTIAFVTSLALLSVCSLRTVQAQTEKNDSASVFVPGVSVHGGRIIRNYPDFPDHQVAGLAQLDVGFQTRGHRPWQADMRYPETGATLVVGSLGNAEVLGTVVGVMPYLSWKLNGSRKWALNMKAGLGFAWFNNPYHEISNPRNTLMGSSFSNITQLSLSAMVGISRYLYLDAGFSFFHFSNGHTRLPNLGINMPTLFTGIRLRLPGNDPDHRYPHPDTATKRYQMVVELLGGRHEFGESTEPVGGISYPVYGLGLGLRWLPARLHVFTASVEWNYYASFRDFATLNLMTDHQMWLYASTVSLYAGHEFMMGRLSIDTRVGFYLFNPFRTDYRHRFQQTEGGAKLINTNKLGINWYLRPPASARVNVRVGMYIKANLGQADYAGVGISLVL